MERKQPGGGDCAGSRMRVLLPFRTSSARNGVGRYRIDTKQHSRLTLSLVAQSSSGSRHSLTAPLVDRSSVDQPDPGKHQPHADASVWAKAVTAGFGADRLLRASG
jgi:hypothetical protein